MESKWTTSLLGDLCEFRAGAVFKPHLQGNTTGAFPFVKVSDMNLPQNKVCIQEANNWVSEDDIRELKAKPLPPGTVIFAKIGEALRQNRLRRLVRDTIIDNNMMGVVPDSARMDQHYLYYALSQFDFSDIAQGTALPYLTIAALSALQLDVPSLPDQRAIASLLGALDDKIELNRQMNETLEATVRLFFKDWFIDFGPTRAKAEYRPPYLAPELWSLFPDALNDDDKPMGWKAGTLAAISRLNPEVWGSKNAPFSVEYVDLANTKWGEIEQTQWFEWKHAPSRARRILHPGDTIIGTVRPGNGSFALVGTNGLTGSTGFAVLRPQRPEYREAVYIAATSPETIETLSHLADGAAYPAVRPEVVASQPIIIPDQNCLKAFSAQTAPLINLVLANRKESRTLVQTRDLLLPKLMSGEIRLREAEKLVEQVA
jgi:type I restriction enzyme S subunit